ncbi:hypothetical protein ANN_24099 [Periplaneta americana]|uniref:Uncharacterized protein n=1 Tax=Periplaneta americana TaxID=6978 RepID=A0ABQ8S2T8_PERAM|nr:hypothetical protein ANN_24099 [Periplaneta americana]
MAGLCEGGNEPPGSLKASKWFITLRSVSFIDDYFVHSPSIGLPSHALLPSLKYAPRIGVLFTLSAEVKLQFLVNNGSVRYPCYSFSNNERAVFTPCRIPA